MLRKLCAALVLFLSLNSFGQSFNSIWSTSEVGTSNDDQITIPTNPTFTYDYNVDWGDGTIDNNITGDITHTYAAQGTYMVSISGIFPAIYFNNGGDRRKIIEILAWGDISWQSMEDAFHGCENLNFDAIDSPDLSNVTSLKNMFRGTTSFNGIVNNWDTGTITDISGMFANAQIFNRPLDNWNTISVTDMSETFSGANDFNEPLDNWNTASVITMNAMFTGASDFNQNINNWDVSLVTDMTGMFRYTNSFNRPLNNWNVSNVTNMSNMFEGSAYNLPLNNWDVSNVINMSGMFSQYSRFNQNINDWNVSSVTDMSNMFLRATQFNQPLDNWDVSNVTNMSGMFDGFVVAMVFNQPLNSWDVSNVTDMSKMFRDCRSFDQPLNNWVTSNVLDMSQMFEDAEAFNQDLSSWDVSQVTDMNTMFQETDAFNQPLNGWNVSTATNMGSMFFSASAFNLPLDNWDVSNVENFQGMFGSSNFNQDITNWNTSMATNMRLMFSGAASFNQNLASWDISGVTNMTDMLSNSGISQENYDNILIGWASQTVTSNVTLGATNLNYCDGRNERQDLIDNFNWTITGDIVNCSFVFCAEITIPRAGDTQVPANSDIRWAPTPNATGYRVTVTRDDGSGPVVAYDQTLPATTVGIDFTNEFNPGDEVSVLVIPFNAEGDAVGCTPITFTVVESWVNSPDAFKLTYDTRLQEVGHSTPPNQLRIQSALGITYDYNIDWGDGQYDNNVTGEITHTYLVPGIYTVSIIGDFPAPYHTEFNSDSIKLLSIDQWGTQVWQSMASAFAGCENMEYNASDIPDLSSVTNMSSMFIVCRNFNGNINDWDVSNVTNMTATFGVASIFNQPLDDWDVSNVTNMALMFFRTDDFNQDISNWDTSSVTSMSRMFEDAKAFNESLNPWNVSAVTNMNQMFNRADIFDQPLNSWDVSSVQDMGSMFTSALAFNQNINSWNVSNVTNMSGMFRSATTFNQPLNSWNVGSVVNMTSMFASTTNFNQSLSNWDVTEVTNMSSMFSSAAAFNQNLNNWNVTNVTNMQSMFFNATAYNQPMDNWDVNSVVNMRSMFDQASSFNQPLNTWNVSAVADMTSMFEEAVAFDQPLNNWDVSSVTLMQAMFKDATLFNQPLNDWNVSVVTNMAAMFNNAELFDQPLNNWNTGEALTMEEMFSGAIAFNQNIDSWNTSFVTTMEEMFKDATSYNQTMDSWNVASVTTMESMFQNAVSFNSSIDGWNVRGVTTMESMFEDATSFNQTLNSWRVPDVQNMNFMFRDATAYNQSMDRWILGNVSMRAMLQNASAFNQNLADWDVSNVTEMDNMLDDTALIRENYDNTLIGWSEQTLILGIILGAQGLPYCDALEERQAMIDNYGWNIVADVLDCPIPECTQLVSPLNGAIDVPVNTNLTWEPSLFARGYRLTVGTTSGGNDIVDNETINDATSYEFATDFIGGETVFVTLIPFNDEGDAVGPCTEENFTISATPATVPDCTMLSLPFNGAVDVSISTDLSWEPIANADGYRLSLGTTSGATDILNNEDVGNVTTYDLVANLPEDIELFVTIVPYNDEGDATACIEESFTTELIPVPPSCTTISEPLNNATNVLIDTDLSWNAVDGATGYLVVVGNTQGGIEVANNIDVGNVTTYDFPSDLTENRTFYVTIIPYNDVGDAIGCQEESFRTGNSTLNDPPACTNLTAPLNGEMNISVATDISWNAIPNTDGYRLTIGTTSGGNNILDNEDVGNVTTYDLPTDLPVNSAIFVSIVPYNGFGDAIGCNDESFSTELASSPPNCTSLTMPVNGAIAIDIATNLTWEAVTDIDGYRLTLGTTSGGNDLLDNVDVGNVLSYDPVVDFPSGTEIFATIIPYNGTGDALGCSEESFTTALETALACTQLSEPLNGATDVSVFTDILWDAEPIADGYLVTIGTISGGNDIAANVNVGNATTYDIPTDLPFGSEIFVTIVPYDSVGTAVGCSEESFTTESALSPPLCTMLMGPDNGAVNVPVDTDLAWDPIPNVDGYRLTVTGSASTANNLVDVEVTTGAAYDLPAEFENGETVTVLIVPFNAAGDAVGCTTQSFTIIDETGSVPDCTSLSMALTNAATVSVSSDLTWEAANGADGYRLTVGTTSGGNNILDNLDVGNVLTYDLPNDLPYEQEVFVTIVPYNSFGDAVGCSEQSFTTVTEPMPPACTNLLTPLNLDIDVSVSVILSWNAAMDSDGYRLTVGTASGLGDILNNEDIGNLTSFNLPNDLPENTEIFVSIVPYNAVGDAEFCEEESFITETLAPETPPCTTITGPEDGSTNVPVNTNITWNAIGDVDGYIVNIGTSEGGTDILDNEDLGLATSYELLQDLPFEQEIFVSVLPYNSEGTAVDCEVHSFTTIAQPEVESLYGFSPDNDGVNDFWVIEGIEQYPDNTVLIYNRWGDMVFKIDGYDNSANVFRGEANQLTGFGAGQLPEGTYFFHLILPEDNNLKQTKGYLVLKR